MLANYWKGGGPGSKPAARAYKPTRRVYRQRQRAVRRAARRSRPKDVRKMVQFRGELKEYNIDGSTGFNNQGYSNLLAHGASGTSYCPLTFDGAIENVFDQLTTGSGFNQFETDRIRLERITIGGMLWAKQNTSLQTSLFDGSTFKIFAVHDNAPGTSPPAFTEIFDNGDKAGGPNVKTDGITRFTILKVQKYQAPPHYSTTTALVSDSGVPFRFDLKTRTYLQMTRGATSATTANIKSGAIWFFGFWTSGGSNDNPTTVGCELDINTEYARVRFRDQ